MLEYIFFHKQLLDQFLEQLERHDIPCETRDDEMGLVAAIPDDLDDALAVQIDDIYDALIDRTESLLDDDEKHGEKHLAAISISLANGETVEAPVNPALLKRVLSVLSYEELNELVEAVADAIENPDHRPFCQR